jgi:hypothetical protein
MRKISTCLAVLLFSFIGVLAQKDLSGSLTQHVTKVTFVEPGIAHEFPLGRTSTFFLRGGLTASLATNYYNEITGVLFRPFASGSYRAYYNFSKRNLAEKNTEKNSANYFAILALYATPPLNKGTDYNTDLNNSLLNTGIVWGLQRNYRSGFSLDLNIGLGYLKGGNTEGFGVIGEFNIGWWFGAKGGKKD